MNKNIVSIIFLFLLTNFEAYPKECIHLTDRSGTIILAQKVIDLLPTYQSSLDIIDENQEDLAGNTQSILDTVEAINDKIREIIEDTETNKKPSTKQTIEDLEQQIAALELQISALNNELESLINLYEDMETGEAEIQVKIGQIWDLQIKDESFPYKSKLITKQGFLGGLFDFLGDFDAIFGGVAAFDVAFSILFDILLDFAGGERSVALKKYRKSVEKELVKVMRYKKPLPITKIINRPGIYKLQKGMNSGIRINSDNVILDLDNNAVLADSMIPIIIETNKKNIIIKNGSIMGGNNYIEAPVGILLKEGSKFVIIDNIDISFCRKAIHFKGSEKSPITNCKIQNSLFDSNLKSIVLDFATHTIFNECKIRNCFEQGIEQNNSYHNHLDAIIEL